MSDNGEVILEMLGEDSALNKKNNPVRRIIDDGIGGWYDKFEEDFNFEDFFLDTATGKYLDLWGKQYKINRKTDESDDDYRKRIIYESLGHLTVNYLMDVFGLTVYSYVEDYNPLKNTLTSDNEYINDNGFMIFTTDTLIKTLNKKLILDSNIHLFNCWGCLFFDSGTNGFIKEDWGYNKKYFTVISNTEGMTIINNDSAARVFWLNKPGTDKTSEFDWTENVTITFDIVDSVTQARLQLYDGTNNASYNYGGMTGKAKIVKSSSKVEFYLDDVLKQTFNFELGTYRITFSMYYGGKITWKNFKVMPND